MFNKNIDLSEAIASEMNGVLNSDNHKRLFNGSGAVLQKLASDETLEVEAAEDHEDVIVIETSNESQKQDEFVANAANKLVEVSNDLDNAGFDKLATFSLMLANKLVSEAKAKKVKKQLPKGMKPFKKAPVKSDEKSSGKGSDKKSEKDKESKKSSDKEPKKSTKDSKKKS